ncbi:hypothetical protein [Streptomyces griseoflavus]|uniref:hypothetical protein n=1 Tax=Streptomyces griseoflavus TaxID=35619 RepID=UPI00167CD5B7|nr:hypothetical protein [Streptomyces griseoflavus]GGV51509.1 hypothetical protein GCM10010293_63390 [Streptomyces griseoflavus]
MTTAPRGRVPRRPFRAAAAAVAAFAAVLLALGVTGGTECVPGAASRASLTGESPAPTSYSSDTRPYSDDAYVGVRALLTRLERDAGERTMFDGHLLFTPAYAPLMPPRPARPAPAAGHAPPAAAYVPSDLGRAPPVASST